MFLSGALSALLCMFFSSSRRQLLEALGSLVYFVDVVLQSKKTDCNHIFLNFVPTLTLSDLGKLEDTVKSIVLRYGSRIWKLRVTEAEIKMTIKYVAKYYKTK